MIWNERGYQIGVFALDVLFREVPQRKREYVSQCSMVEVVKF